jgi:16S rRNA (cytosine1402-N4)-methyltransferase
MMLYHKPVLLDACISGLEIKPDGIYVDCTYGGGGHASAILVKLKKGKLFAFDQDEDARQNRTEDKRLVFIEGNFRFLKNFLKYHGVDKVDGILADLGVSSHHFDTPGRGFSFRHDSILDMRMNQRAEVTAATILNNYDERKLTAIFWEYGEIKNNRELVRLIVQGRKDHEIKGIQQFLEIIKPCVHPRLQNQYLAKVFQALRIEVNSEIDNLKELLGQVPELLKPGGRLAVISYHSLEDKLVKNFMKAGNLKGEIEKDFYGNPQGPFKLVNTGGTVPTEKEIEENNRARSARLRIAERK